MANGKTPADVARELVKATTLTDPALRKKLFDGGASAIAACTDPVVVLARQLAPMSTEAREWEEKYVSGIRTSAAEKIGEARFAAYGKSPYPDATFTLRLSYGTVKGYPMNGAFAPSNPIPYRFSFGSALFCADYIRILLQPKSHESCLHDLRFG